jgi:hypothetical protein
VPCEGRGDPLFFCPKLSRQDCELFLYDLSRRPTSIDDEFDRDDVRELELAFEGQMHLTVFYAEHPVCKPDYPRVQLPVATIARNDLYGIGFLGSPYLREALKAHCPAVAKLFSFRSFSSENVVLSRARGPQLVGPRKRPWTCAAEGFVCTGGC